MQLKYRNMKRILFNKKFWYFFTIFFVIFFLILLRRNAKPVLNYSKKCLQNMIKDVTTQNFDLYWLTLGEKMNKCIHRLSSILPIKEFRNEDEIKYGFLPNSNKDECNVITLGIGRDVRSEMELSSMFDGCNFFGVDPDAERSGRIYKTILNGTFIKGLVGAKNGNYNASVLDKYDDLNYKRDKLEHFSFEELLSKNYNNNFIDFLFMDIEGDEFALMEDLIYHPKKYPTICQINVEYHNPFLDNRGIKFFETLLKSISHGPYFPLKVETKLNFLFNRIFFVNLDSFCVNKFLRYHFV